MKKPVKAVGLAVILGTVCLFSRISAGTAASLLQTLDPDHDGTVDLNEAKTAGAAVFDRLERDHDGTLDAGELKGRLNAKEPAAADPDHDGTLTKGEYLAVVEQRFTAANPDNDGTLDAKELKSKSGQALARLLK